MKSFDEAIAARGIDERHQIHLLRRRDRYHHNSDRPKLFADTNPNEISAIKFRTNANDHGAIDAKACLMTLKSTTETAAYVSAWCRVNHLKECK